MIIQQLIDNNSTIKFQINTDINDPQLISFPIVASLTNENFVVIWQSENSLESKIYGQLFDLNGNSIGNEFQVNTDNNFYKISPSVIGLKDGGFVVAWVSKSQVDKEKGIDGVYGQKFDSQGNPIDDEFLIYASSYYSDSWNPYNYRGLSALRINQSTDGNLLAVFDEYTLSIGGSAGGYYINVSGQIFEDNGNSMGDNFPIRDGSAFGGVSSITLLNNNNSVVAWDSLFNKYFVGGVYIDILNESTSILDSDLKIDTLINGSSEDDYEERNPSVTSLNNGGFFVTWEARKRDPESHAVTGDERFLDADIYGQFFTENGTAINQPIKINGNFNSDLTLLNQTLPSAVTLNENEIVVIWQSEQLEPLTSGIYGQRLDINGNLTGIEVTINPFNEFDQFTPSVTTSTDDNLIVVWSSKVEENVNNISGEILNSQMFDSLLTNPLYRFQNSDNLGTYLFVGEEEKQSIIANYPNFIGEGEAFKVAIAPDDDLIVINRFQNKDIPGTYLYAGEEESISIRANYPNFVEEGIAFYVYDANAGKGIDFYRFQNSQIPGTYIFVGEEERQNIIANFPNFIEEGVAFEVLV